MIILGIDPGSRALGLGVVRTDGRRLAHVASEVIRPPAGAIAERLAHIHERLHARLEEWQPERGAIESVFAAKNARSALQLGQARGVALAACGLAGLDCVEYAPTAVKQAVVGFGMASKAQVQAMVQRLLGLESLPPTDAADALAVAICHAHGAASPRQDRIALALARDARRPARGPRA